METLDGLIRAVLEQADEPLSQLAAASATVAELDELGDALLTHFVDRCRRAGHTWAEIGGHLGVTRQAAQKRFVDAVGDDTPALERLTPRAHAAIERSRSVARDMRHNYVGTEHLLLAMFDIEGGIAARALERLGVARGDVEDAVVARVGFGPHPVEAAPPFTPRARRVLEESVDVAVGLGHNYVGTEHTLIALRASEGLARTVLEQQGVGLDAVRNLVVELLRGLPKA